MDEERAQDCPSRIAMGLGSGFLAGNLFGGIASNWGDVPVVLRNKPLPALARTASVMMQHGATLGLVGLAYSTVDVRYTYLTTEIECRGSSCPLVINFFQQIN